MPTNYYDHETKGYVMIPVEKHTRAAVTGVPNVYCVTLFACCREVKKLSKFEVENFLLQQQDLKLSLLDSRGNSALNKKTGNFIFSFGCQPSYGVQADSKFIKDFITLINSNFEENGSVILPDVFSKVKSQDAAFELVSSNLSRKIKL